MALFVYGMIVSQGWEANFVPVNPVGRHPPSVLGRRDGPARHHFELPRPYHSGNAALRSSVPIRGGEHQGCAGG
jgi:hypothetical protein